MNPLRSILRRLWNVVRDPALYVIGFTFYAGMSPRLTLELVALCYAGTVLVMVIHAMWQSRHAEDPHLADDIGHGVVWGSLLFVIGFGWGAATGYILMWMTM